MIYGYIRVSSKEQNLERQIDALLEYNQNICMEHIFSDKQTGKNFKRDGYIRMKSALVKGDEVVIKELDRLGRNKRAVKQELEWFRANGIIVRILNVPTTLIDFQGQEWLFDMVNNILIEVMASIAEEERDKIDRRRIEGIASAKARGTYKVGRNKLDVPKFPLYREKVENKEMTVVTACKELGISRASWYNLVAKEV